MLADESALLYNEVTTREHLLWMLNEIENNKEQSLTKKHRWLGYVQGIIIAEKLTTVSEEREFTRPLFDGA